MQNCAVNLTRTLKHEKACVLLAYQPCVCESSHPVAEAHTTHVHCCLEQKTQVAAGEPNMLHRVHSRVGVQVSRCGGRCVLTMQ